MKIVFTNVILFVLLSLTISSLTSCTKTPETTDGENTAQGNTVSEKKKVEYPPMPASIMQSEIKDLEGNSFKLEDKKGKVILVNLWATWCGPCRGEMPHLVEMQETYRDKGFEIIGLDIDPETVEEINKFAKEMKLNYQLAYAKGSLVNDLSKVGKFNGIPQSYLIDRDGNLRGVFLGGSGSVVKTMKETVEKTVNE